MAKVVVARKKRKGDARPAKAVASKRVRDKDGRSKLIHELDFGSDTFGRDFQYVFSKNVTKARRENKRVLGSSDVAITKR
jgi:hypothetical protein